MIDRGTQLTLRPTDGDEDDVIGRVTSTTAESLVVRVGRHPWLRPGARITCSARQGTRLSRFTAFVDDVDHEDGFRITIRRPLRVEDANRREGPRIEAGRPLVWSIVRNTTLDPDQHEGYSVDVSTGGLAFETTAAPPKAGSTVAVALDLPIGNLVTLGTVRGIDDGTDARFDGVHLVRVESIAMARDQKKDLGRWIQEQLTMGSAVSRR